jgi:two-component system, chemotaxis family, chemotaxis protein CheY
MPMRVFAAGPLLNAMIGNGTRVLVVDDDEDVRQCITDRLEQAGFAVVQASDGLQALAELHRRHFDVVVTDCNMPRLSGFDLLRQCRHAWPGTPVIIMTAAMEPTDTSPQLSAHLSASGSRSMPIGSSLWWSKPRAYPGH